MVCIDAPRTSDNKINSCLLSSVMCPTAVRNSMAVFHSSSVSRTSRTKAWRWVTRDSISSLSRGSLQSANEARTVSVRVFSTSSVLVELSVSWGILDLSYQCVLFSFLRSNRFLNEYSRIVAGQCPLKELREILRRYLSGIIRWDSGKSHFHSF